MRRGKATRCQEVVELLIDYLAGELSEAEIVAIRKHLEGCANCESFFDSLKITVRMKKKLRAEDVPPEVVDRLRSFLRKKITLFSIAI